MSEATTEHTLRCSFGTALLETQAANIIQIQLTAAHHQSASSLRKTCCSTLRML
jgi:hypothetical protein